MQRKTTKRLAIIAFAAIFLGAVTGCNELAKQQVVRAFDLGYFLGSLTGPTTTETVCYRNGVQIDCSELNLD